MSNFPLQFSEYGENNSPQVKKNTKKNRTYKNKKKYNTRVQNFLKTMEEEDNLVDFKPSNLPLPSPEQTEDHEIENDSQLNNDAVTQQYYNQY